MRLFVAAELPEVLRGRIRALQDQLKEIPLPVRFTRPDGIHLTLKFLGETPDIRVAEIKAALGDARWDLGPFRLEAAKAVAFPERGRPRLVWIEVEGDVAAARRLAGALDEATARLGYPRETRPFTPHLTLGRVKGPERGPWRERLETIAGAAAGEFEIRDYVLFESRLGPGGSVYRALERFPLRRAGGEVMTS